MIKWLLPFRFVSLVAHLVLAILFLTNRDFNVRLCLEWNYTEDQYRSQDNELATGLGLTVAFLIIELLTFMSGISMLHPKQTLYSFCMHTAGTLAMLSFMLDGWQCGLFWWMFATTVAGPLLTESYVVLRTLLLLLASTTTTHGGGGAGGGGGVSASAAVKRP